MKLTENQTLEQILESAIVASWQDLTNGAQPGLIHVEYNFTAGGTLDDLRIWSSITRGHWLLTCEYGMSASKSHSGGVRFDNGYHSEGLAHTLEFVMSHGSRNRSGPDLGPRSLRPRQISPPRACPGLTFGFLHVDRWPILASARNPHARYSLTCSVLIGKRFERDSPLGGSLAVQHDSASQHDDI